jgi:hypothetical protein
LRVLATALLTFALGAVQSIAQEQPANTLKELSTVLTKCWKPADDFAGMQVTVRLSLDNGGRLLGQPSIRHSVLGTDETLNAAFVASVLTSLKQCLPANITPQLGGAIAGRPFTLIFRQSVRERNA